MVLSGRRGDVQGVRPPRVVRQPRGTEDQRGAVGLGGEARGDHGFALNLGLAVPGHHLQVERVTVPLTALATKTWAVAPRMLIVRSHGLSSRLSVIVSSSLPLASRTRRAAGLIGRRRAVGGRDAADEHVSVLENAQGRRRQAQARRPLEEHRGRGPAG